MQWWDWLLIVLSIGLLVSAFHSVIKHYNIVRFNDAVLKLKNNPYLSIMSAIFGLMFAFSAISRINNSISCNMNGIMANIIWASVSFTWAIRNTFEYTMIVTSGIAVNLKMYKWSEIISWQWKEHKDYEMDYAMVFTINKSVKKKKSGNTIEFRIDEKYKDEVEKLLNQHIQAAKVEE